MNHNKNVKGDMVYPKIIIIKQRRIHVLVVTAGLFDEQALDGPTCLKSELTPKGKRGQKELPEEMWLGQENTTMST